MGCMNIVIYLLQCEANPDVSTIRGETPLHLASRANQTDIIRILLRNGAQVDAKARVSPKLKKPAKNSYSKRQSDDEIIEFVTLEITGTTNASSYRFQIG